MNSSTALSGIARSSVLVDLRIRSYTGRRQDKTTQEEVTVSKGAASRRAASVYKSLFADCKELEAITSVQTRARAKHYTMTLPWSDTGSRLLPIAGLRTYKDAMADLQTEFDAAVQAFLVKYDTLVAAAAFQLGTLFDRSEYPKRHEVAARFSLTVEYTPLPTSGDFRIDAENDIQTALMQEYDARTTALVTKTQRDAWTRLHETLTHLVSRLSDKDEGKRNRIFDTLVTNPLELCGLLTAFNITNDPALEAARVELEKVMMGTSAEELRKSPDERAHVKRSAEQILSAFDWSIVADADADADDVEAA
jgi:hypothetical protein